MSPLQTLTNLLAAIHEGDFSIRGRPADRRDALGAAMAEVNALGETLRRQRLGALEAGALLDKVMAEIDVAVFAFDGQERLVLVNPAGGRLLIDQPERLVGKSAAELELGALLECEASCRVVSTDAPTTPANKRHTNRKFQLRMKSARAPIGSTDV